MFAHEKFHPYIFSIEFAKIVVDICKKLPTGSSSIRDQLKRATFSVSLNIAEGTGKFSEKEKLRYYRIARGSAIECAAICDILELQDPKLKVLTAEGKKLLISIVNILSTICSK